MRFLPGFLKNKNACFWNSTTILGEAQTYHPKASALNPGWAASWQSVLCEMSHFGCEFCFNLAILPIPASWLSTFFLFISPQKSSICKVSSCKPPSKHCCYWLLYFFVSKALSCPKEYKENNLHNILSEFFPSLIPQSEKKIRKEKRYQHNSYLTEQLFRESAQFKIF